MIPVVHFSITAHSVWMTFVWRAKTLLITNHEKVKVAFISDERRKPKTVFRTEAS
jgi:hypothetical protein